MFQKVEWLKIEKLCKEQYIIHSSQVQFKCGIMLPEEIVQTTFTGAEKKTHSRNDMSKKSSYENYSYNEIENLAKQKAMMKDENYYKEK